MNQRPAPSDQPAVIQLRLIGTSEQSVQRAITQLQQVYGPGLHPGLVKRGRKGEYLAYCSLALLDD